MKPPQTAGSMRQTVPVALIVVALGYQWVYNGANYIAFKLTVEALPAFVVGSLRFGAAAFILAPFALRRVFKHGPPTLRQTLSASAIGVLLLVGGQAAALWGVQFLPAGVASVFGASSPLFLALLSWAWLRQPLSGRQLAGVGIGFAGMILMAWSSAKSGEFNWIGVAAALFAAVAWAGGALLAKRLDLPEDPLVGLTIQLAAAAVLLALIGSADGDFGHANVGHAPPSVWAALAFLVIASTLVGYATFLWLNQSVSSTLANTFFYVAPVIAMALSAAFLREPLTWPKAAAALVALLGVLLMVTSGRSPNRGRLHPADSRSEAGRPDVRRTENVECGE